MGNLMESINALMLNSFVLGIILTILVELAVYAFLKDRGYFQSNVSSYEPELSEKPVEIARRSRIKKVVTDGYSWLEVSKD